MKSDRWSLVEEIFQGALERPPAERRRYVENACKSDKGLLSEIESLLESDNDSERTLRSLIADDIKEAAQASSHSETGLQLGPYRLVRELDSGGMGIVYLAVRSDDHYFQVVAIKTIRRGHDSPELVHRFRTERQILATLNHPSIGTILDGGETEDGRPFIVMEYVEGQPITQASKGRALSIRQRVELFQSVCSAVHYSHQKLIIHRDIKPSNVMVTPDGMVKLIDFGISKPLAPQLVLSDNSPTETSLRRMTPDYASPEQIQGKQLTTATDIYSLGVLLFELLTGSRPYTLDNLSSAAADRVIAEQGGRKPSSALNISNEVRKELSGDLDSIVLKAMDIDPSRRYLTVEHFNEDLSRYLQGKPVSARKTTPVYVLNKFVRRHKAAVFAACAIAVILSSLFFLYWRQSRRVDRRVKQVRTLADSAILDMTDKLQHSSASTETQAALFQSALSYLGELRKTTGSDPRLLLELSKAYVRVGDLEGSPLVANLGNSGTAVTSYQEASRIALEAQARMPGDESTEAVIETYQRLGSIESFLGNLHAANDNYEAGLTWARKFWQQKPNDPNRRRLLATSYAGIGDVNLNSLNPDKALENYSSAFQVFGEAPNGVEDHDRMLIDLYLDRGRALNELGNQSEALASERKAVALAETLVQKFPSSVRAQRALFLACEEIVFPLAGRDVLNVSDSAQAQVYSRKALSIAQMLVGVDGKNAQAQYDLALVYASMGDSFRQSNPQTASVWYRKSIAMTKQLSPLYGAGARHWLAVRDEALAEVLVKKEKSSERLRLLQEANVIRQEFAESSPHGRLHLMRSYCKLSDVKLAANDLPAARQYANAALPFLDAFSVNSPSLLVLRDLGFCYESEGAVPRRVAMDRKLSSTERLAADAESRTWYTKSAEVWSMWNKRGAATPESERERHKVEAFLREPAAVPQQAVTKK
ncbi:serine/threonine protein kinase [Silvibacterium bohemicum]|uniref:Serine/threonine protein kinase n=1 Tax=Silvibacterium bohemicum TaxID=1577686 RepID=A0A841JUD9_9BACT|nr:serine/threonine-protein kinase [Silvibacterium bohemicum]MBB6144770.1 serine/threonine protein kinase [Silvibacterium bohemicum]